MSGVSTSLRRRRKKRQPWFPAILEQKAANERLQQLTAAEYQKATIEQLEHISVIGGDD